MSQTVTNKRESGFTLIELLVVVAIVGVLAAIAIPQFQSYKDKGYLAGCEVLLKSSRTDLEAYLASSLDGSYLAASASRTNLSGTPAKSANADLFLPATRVGKYYYTYVDTRACSGSDQVSFYAYASHHKSDKAVATFKPCNLPDYTYTVSKPRNQFWPGG